MKFCSFNKSDLQGLRYYYEEAKKLDIDDVRGILKDELGNDKTYNTSWGESKRRFDPNVNRVMEEECYLAVMAYTTGHLYGGFNKACLKARDTADSWEKFRYKSLFYFLIRAFNELPQCSSGTLYRAQADFTVHEPVAFPKFLSTSKTEKTALRLAKGKQTKATKTKIILLTLLRVPAEWARDISQFSPFPGLEEVLIWPFCTYKLVSERTDETGMRTITLEFDGIWPDIKLTPPTSNELNSQATAGNLKEGRKRAHSGERTPSTSFDGNAKKSCPPGAPFPQPATRTADATPATADLKPEASSADVLQPALTKKPS